jgi:hypothetical protein
VGFFFVMDGGKEVVRLGRLGCFGAVVILGGAGVTLLFGGQKDTSVLKRSDRSLLEPDGPRAPGPQTGGNPVSGTVGKMLQNSESKGQGERPRESHGRGVKVNYKAQQVLVSDGAFDPARTMPMGTNLIGKTLTTIDTRQAEQLVKVLLPYGGRASSGGELPKNSVLFGQVTYGGKGEKVFVKFTKGVFPSGQEFQVEAQGLSPGDYSPGLAGRFHGNADMRVASSLGLTMVAGMSDVLTEKESIGGGGLMPGSVTAKSNMRNAIYHGVGAVAQSEASRQAEAIGEAEEYVTVDAGTDLIISLSKAYVEK